MNGLEDLEIKKAVKDAISKVIDPELGMSLVELGMIKNVYVKNDEVTIEMALTSPMCPLSSYLVNSVKEKAQSVKGVKKVDVRIVEFGV
ncbi:MAG: iron-sulfur cluster assembly protein [Candidatus Methanomethylicia archaeon]